MIRLLTGVDTDQSLEADIHVIGAGIAGLLLGTRLAERGLRVVITESGGKRQQGDSHPLNEVVHLRSAYRGAEFGRARCLGGTSTLWGGAMIPFLAADMSGPTPWPICHGDLLRYLPEIEALFGLPPGPYDHPDLVPVASAVASFVPRLAKWPTFGRRNVASLLKASLNTAAGPEVWLEATATTFAFTPDGRIAHVVAEAPNGRHLTVRAREVVIAAGAIESTRLLLLVDRQGDRRIFSPDDVLGHYFHDHLSAFVGTVEPSDRAALNRVAGFQFEARAMRNLRFEPSELPEVRAKVPPSFAHIAFTSHSTDGFSALRDVFRQLQQRRVPAVRTHVSLARGTPWLARAVWWRMWERRLLYPEDASIELHMVVEQESQFGNRVILSPDRRDRYGHPLAAIDWAVSKEDEARLTRSTDMFLEYWARSPLARLARVARRRAGEAEAELANGSGIYHPGGSTRIGRSPVEGVLTPDLTTFRVPNLSVASTSAFPTGGGANPTMMLMMAALRLADRLAERLK